MTGRLRDLLTARCLTLLTTSETVGSAQPRGAPVAGLQSDLPHPDPKSAAAGATDQAFDASISEGLARFGPDGAIRPRAGRS